jgi:hypothetical protein
MVINIMVLRQTFEPKEEEVKETWETCGLQELLQRIHTEYVARVDKTRNENSLSQKL